MLNVLLIAPDSAKAILYRKRSIFNAAFCLFNMQRYEVLHVLTSPKNFCIFIGLSVYQFKIPSA